MKKYLIYGFISFVLIFSSCTAIHSENDAAKKIAPSIYDQSIKFENIDGEVKDLNSYRGKVLLIVNTALNCGFTPQLKELAELNAKYKEQGLEILAFPSNDFTQLEPESNKEIKQQCTKKYNTNYPLFAKTTITGSSKSTLYKFLTENSGEDFKGEILWTFEKFLLDREGRVSARFGSWTNPLSKEMVMKLEVLLNIPA